MTKQNITNKQYSFVRDRFNRLVKPCYRYKADETKSDFKEYQKRYKQIMGCGYRCHPHPIMGFLETLNPPNYIFKNE